MTHERERGFSFLEVLVATALTAAVILAATTAVANSVHGAALADRHMALNDDALDALSDVRAISAYDPAMFAHLAGRHATMSLSVAGQPPETISVAIAGAPASGSMIATATASQGPLNVTQRQTLYLEAPAPGSTVGN